MYHLQGKTEGLTGRADGDIPNVQNELQQLLTDLAAERVALIERHEAGARAVSHYDFNNTYQYVIAREEMHVTWVADAVQDVSADLGQGEASLDDVAEPQIGSHGRGAAAEAAIIGQDRDGAQAFVDKWKPIVATLAHARHRTMLNVILGETLEHRRFFEQAAAGNTDLLGRRDGGESTGGEVLPVRWIEQ